MPRKFANRGFTTHLNWEMPLPVAFLILIGFPVWLVVALITGNDIIIPAVNTAGIVYGCVVELRKRRS